MIFRNTLFIYKFNVMRQSKKLLFGACLLLGGMAFAQGPSHPRYIGETTNTTFANAYKNWVPGTPLFKGEDIEDNEEFYISRVKPKERFTDADTQVNTELDSRRKLLWWCPIGTASGGGWNALPSFHFDSEAFSMWSYVDIYGNWTAPFIRMPGAFADICHKNGVQASVLASVPWSVTIKDDSEPHGTNMKAMIDKGPEFLLKFLRYYGIDGIGYNSEFNISGMTEGLKNLLSQSFAKKDECHWPTFNNEWYSLMNNSGGVGGTDYLSDSNKDWFNYNGHPTSNGYFMNYNWGASGLQTAVTTAESFGRSSYDVYGGMDFQGRNRANWVDLKNYPISVGIWGAHDMNMVFETRSELGSEVVQKQKTYQLISENVFTGSSYNPVNTPAISNLLAHSSENTQFHGFSKFITARSALQGNLKTNPFVTYFNVGNGQFFNVAGETTFAKEWYNIGIQDYLPTWRWWLTSSFMGRDKADVPANGIKAEFTWDDAYFGGSCLSISGKTELEYLQLFKTQYAMESGYTLRIRYKVLGGSGKIAWSCMAKENPGTEIASRTWNLDASNEWIVKEIKVSGSPAGIKLVDKTLSMLGLKFQDTSEDFNLLIGEISLLSGTDTPTPNSPTITKATMLTRNYKGLDFKVIFKMKDRPAGQEAEPIYNEDVDTWYYKIYMQQEGEDATVCTATTSWAAYVVSAPYALDGKAKMRIGVSAVSMDGQTESATVWSNYMDFPDLEVVEGIGIDKSIIKTNEEFTISYVDPTHSPAQKWTLSDTKTGTEIDSKASTAAATFTLDKEGIYDLTVVHEDGTEEIHRSYVLISPESIGTSPKIESLKANNSDEGIQVDAGTEVTYSYIGRKADGQVSRGLLLSEKAFGIPGEQLGNNFGSQPFTLSFWLSPTKFTHESAGTQFINIRTKADPWPASDWGYVWSTITTDNTIQWNYRWRDRNGGTLTKFPSFKFEANQWYHIAIVCDYNSGRRIQIYVNGKEIEGVKEHEYDPDYNPDIYPWQTTNVIMLGGKAFSRSGLNGYLDEFQLYNKALSLSEIEASMKHQTTIPDNLIGYWDFETDANDNYEFISTGKEALKAYVVEVKTISEGNNQYAPSPSLHCPGSPFIDGRYMITTTPSWELGKGNQATETTGNSEAGQAKVSYARDGVYSAKLTLYNDWGTDTETFEYVTVGVPSGIENNNNEPINTYRVFPNPFEDEVNIQFVESGSYSIEVNSISGQLVSQETIEANGGEFIKVSVNGTSGTYFISIKQNGKVVKTLKVIKK